MRKSLSEKEIPINLAEITELPTNEVPVSAEVARKVLGLLNALEEHDDIQNVYSNCDIPEELLKELESED